MKSTVSIIYATLACTILTVGLYLGYHYFTSIPDDNVELLYEAERYFADKVVVKEEDNSKLKTSSFRVVEKEQCGDYMAMLIYNDETPWGICVFERDEIFTGRWYAGGGSFDLSAGTIESWNFWEGENDVDVIVVYGGELPDEAVHYGFYHKGVWRIKPMNETILDLYVIPGVARSGSQEESIAEIERHPIMLDRNQKVLGREGLSLNELLLEMLKQEE